MLLLSLAINYVPWVRNDLKQQETDATPSAQFIIIALRLEVLNTAIIVRCSSWPAVDTAAAGIGGGTAGPPTPALGPSHRIGGFLGCIVKPPNYFR
jgi:hypothetical protein